jgi:hypothetical protein
VVVQRTDDGIARYGGPAGPRAGPVNWTTWLRVNEELPSWLDPLLSESDSMLAGLSAQQTELLRRALSVERIGRVGRQGAGEVATEHPDQPLRTMPASGAQAWQLGNTVQ